MEEHIRPLAIGAARATIIGVGDLSVALGEWLPAAADQRPARYAPDLDGPLRIPVQCVLVELPETTLLIDAPLYDRKDGMPFAIAGYVPPPGLIARIAELGVRPERVDRVILTHSHFDHYNGVTRERDGAWVPAFPHARHYLGRADWDDARIQDEIDDPKSLPGRSLGVLRRLGLLKLVDGDLDLGGGVRIVAAAGESPGHQIVRIESGGAVLYCLGDLVHHPLEIERPEWMVPWADAEATLASRRALLRDAEATGATLVATHIRGAGRVERVAGEIRWVDLTLR